MGEMTGKTWRLGLGGYPLGHSLSPRLHATALAELGLVGEYELFEVPPDNLPQLGALLNRMREGSLNGLNLTIPHKQSVLQYLDELTPRAAAIGAVNTIYIQDDHLVGDNTDASGFRTDLAMQTGWDLGVPGAEKRSPCSALVLGAGGSARAVVYTLASLGWRISICARRPEQAAQLIADLGQASIPLFVYLPWEARGNLGSTFLSDIDLLVNTTPLGMVPHDRGSPWPEGVRLPPTAFVYDLVYNPAETTLLRQARSAGMQAANGLGMLVEQAALAFEHWTGLSAPRQPMLEAVKLISSEGAA